MFLPGQAWVAGLGSEHLAAQLSTARRRQNFGPCMHGFHVAPLHSALGSLSPALELQESEDCSLEERERESAWVNPALLRTQTTMAWPSS